MLRGVRQSRGRELANRVSRSGDPGESLLECDPSRVCGMLVGLPDVTALAVGDVAASRRCSMSNRPGIVGGVNVAAAVEG